MTSFLIMMETRERRLSPSAPLSTPNFWLTPYLFSVSRSLVADPLSLLTLTRAFNNRVAFRFVAFVRTPWACRGFNTRKALVGEKKGKKGVASERKMYAHRVHDAPLKALQVKVKKETYKRYKKKFASFELPEEKR